VSLLLGAGADPNRVNAFGSSPLLEAALAGRDTLLGTLLGAGEGEEEVSGGGARSGWCGGQGASGLQTRLRPCHFHKGLVEEVCA
jgi:ankyrin repeat protein